MDRNLILGTNEQLYTSIDSPSVRLKQLMLITRRYTVSEIQFEHFNNELKIFTRNYDIKQKKKWKQFDFSCRKYSIVNSS